MIELTKSDQNILYDGTVPFDLPVHRFGRACKNVPEWVAL